MAGRQVADWFLKPEPNDAAAAGGGSRLDVCRANNLFAPGVQDVKHGCAREQGSEEAGGGREISQEETKPKS